MSSRILVSWTTASLSEVVVNVVLNIQIIFERLEDVWANIKSSEVLPLRLMWIPVFVFPWKDLCWRSIFQLLPAIPSETWELGVGFLKFGNSQSKKLRDDQTFGSVNNIVGSFQIQLSAGINGFETNSNLVWFMFSLVTFIFAKVGPSDVGCNKIK